MSRASRQAIKHLLHEVTPTRIHLRRGLNQVRIKTINSLADLTPEVPHQIDHCPREESQDPANDRLCAASVRPEQARRH
jgi:hypothetical protein